MFGLATISRFHSSKFVMTALTLIQFPRINFNSFSSDITSDALTKKSMPTYKKRQSHTHEYTPELEARSTADEQKKKLNFDACSSYECDSKAYISRHSLTHIVRPPLACVAFRFLLILFVVVAVVRLSHCVSVNGIPTKIDLWQLTARIHQLLTENTIKEI